MFTILYNLVTRSLIVLLVAMLSVNYLPEKLFHDFPLEPKAEEPINFDLVIPKPWNTKLSDNAEFIQLNNILGPESIAKSKEGLLYTGLADGRIVELNPITNYKIRDVLKFKLSPKCPDNDATRADECGRFLQMRFHNDSLYAIEANTGLYKIDIKYGTKTFIGPKSFSKTVIYNSFAFDHREPNLVYVSVSSTKWDLLRILWSILEREASGQVIAFDVNTGKRVILLDQLKMANGLDIDKKRDQLVFGESTLARVNSVKLDPVRSAFKSAKDGDKLLDISRTALIPITPGYPDNIVIEGDLAYIAIPFAKSHGNELIDHLFTMPNLSKATGRFIFGAGTLIEYVCKNIFYHPLLESSYRTLKCGHIYYEVMIGNSGLLEYNLATGSSRLLGSDKFAFMSEAVPYGETSFLLGSFRSPFLVKAKI